MKNGAALLGAAALVALSAPADAARLTGWYGVFEGGGNYIQDFDLAQSVPPGAPVTSVMATEVGWAALASLGYAYDNGWRAELEAGYRFNQLKDLTLGGVTTPQTGDLSQYTLMANFMYDFPSSGDVTFSLGAGVGAARGRLNGPTLTNAILDDNTSIAFQGIAGLSFRATSWLDLVLNYRFLYVPGFEFEKPLVAPNVAHADTGRLFEHLVTLGFRFGSHQGEFTPMLAPAAPPPPPPPVARQYVIYFGFGKCSITADADTVLTEAASAARTLGAVAIKIVGHTDTVGSRAANQRLSECRAGAAKSNLVNKGIPAGAISATGVGETGLVIETGDNVKEPQNRRATVDLQ
jgi:outer membrane protein OmpA-like peptidoglycan-associated protein